MEAEASSFETSEMLARFLGSTPLLPESWNLCGRSNVMAPQSFLTDEVGGVTYVAFSGVQSVDGLDPFCGNLVPLAGVFPVDAGMFPALEDTVMVDAGLLHLFWTIFHTPVFQNQMFEIKKKQKPVVFTGHSIGGAIAALSSLWLLSYLQSISSPPTVICFTFGSPMIGNEPLSRAIQRQRWGGNFCHLVSKFDILPRLLFAPLAPITTHLHNLLKSWHLTMNSPFFFQDPGNQLGDHEKSELFHFVLGYVEATARSPGTNLSFVPFGNFMFCSSDGAVCVDDATAIVRMLYLTFASGSPSSCIDDHLEYESYVGKISLQFLNRTEEEICESNTYEAGVTLASQSISSGHMAKDCLKMARRIGRTPNLNSANLAIGLSKITPFRAQIEWYKESCDQSDDQLGYYDSFKLRGASKRDFKVFMNRIKLGEFWNSVIDMLEKNQLPHDFHKRAKWVNASQFYKLLVEPLDIAEYYRSGEHRKKGHYMKQGRPRRYKIFDKWWREREAFRENDNDNNSVSISGSGSNNRRSKFASLTQDSCFWAKLEEAREWVEKVSSESDPRHVVALWASIEKFEQYARGLVDRKEVSIDVLAKNSSYTIWVEELRVLKLHSQHFSTQIPGILDRKVVP
ncbi:lipase-like PAD4 isoform X2 [Cynara cardunculus var. scolymus]|uniref:lipase-like PAD4 isoform X2 n=1 Tax=Cynara cardunculus var. scolymus TaxID=59895 RepID=UPI000D624892|nr:lipase-like PAD4 isoform X2 [Cynara cardunculus var. scolymus]